MGTLSEFVNEALNKRSAVIMAVINTTPDSFFDGGKYFDHEAARRQIDLLLREGADMIDVGAESTRPGAKQVSANEQLERAGRTIEYAVSRGALVSIDTSSAVVAEEALRLGAQVVNDVSCLADPALAAVASRADADLILMHSRGSMEQMPGFSNYDRDAYSDIVSDVTREWIRARDAAVEVGLKSERIWFDPGLGFHKNAEQSTAIMRRLAEFRGLGAGTVLGASRKSFIGALDGSPPERRLGGSIAACLRGIDCGASILRVHDVHDVSQAILAHHAWRESPTQAQNSPLRGAVHA